MKRGWTVMVGGRKRGVWVGRGQGRIEEWRRSRGIRIERARVGEFRSNRKISRVSG